MKRVLVLIALTAFSFATEAQKEKEPPKPNVNKALNLVRQSKFDEAKAIVDGVPTHPKTMADAKAWFYRGIVLAAIDTSKKYTGGATDNSKLAGEALTKALELAGPKGLISLSVLENGESLIYTQVMDRFRAKLLNTGNDFFNAEKYPEAMAALHKGTQLMPDDTVFWQYAGFAAYNAEKLDNAVTYIDKYLDLGGTDSRAVNLLIGILFEVNKDYEATIKTTSKLIKRFPNNANMRKVELNSLIQLKRFEEATENLKESLKADPKDVESHYLMGALYEELKNRDEAKRFYQKTVDLDPKHLNAAIRLAIFSDFDGYKKTKTDMDKLDYRDKKQQAQLVELDKVYMRQVGEASNVWEAVRKIDGNNVEVLWNLFNLYSILDAKDKVDPIKAKLKSLGEEVD